MNSQGSEISSALYQQWMHMPWASSLASYASVSPPGMAVGGSACSSGFCADQARSGKLWYLGALSRSPQREPHDVARCVVCFERWDDFIFFFDLKYFSPVKTYGS